MRGNNMVENKVGNTEYLGIGWKNTSKDGKTTFISCKLNKEVKAITGDFLLFENNRKREGKKDPDFNIVKARNE